PAARPATGSTPARHAARRAPAGHIVTLAALPGTPRPDHPAGAEAAPVAGLQEDPAGAASPAASGGPGHGLRLGCPERLVGADGERRVRCPGAGRPVGSLGAERDCSASP